ncbi:MAG: hypothetical protein JWP12_801 [Bacteroidetes bacterium]|nr:hypothetical protein [Bacteroidota bacterium]
MFAGSIPLLRGARGVFFTNYEQERNYESMFVELNYKSVKDQFPS